MVLNWTPEVLLDLIISVIGFIVIVASLISSRVRKITSVKLIDLALVWMNFIMLFEGLAVLFLDLVLYMMCTISIFLSLLFLMLAINYVTKESFLSKDLFFVIILGVLLLYYTFQLDQYAMVIEGGFLVISWTGELLVVGNLVQLVLFLYVFYWGLRSYLNSPYTIKRDAKVFLMGTGLMSLAPTSLLVFWLLEPSFILLAEVIILWGIIVFMLSIIYEPKILYILPFKLIRMIVRDRNGNPLFNHDWTDVEFDATIFAGFLNALKIMSERVMKIGEPFEINLQKGTLIIQNSDLITVGLIATKSSKLIRKALIKFTSAFQERFHILLLQGIKDPEEYQSAIDLIELFFSNFPYSFIKSKHDPLLPMKPLPPQLECKVRNIIESDLEFERIKKEFTQAPLKLVPEFVSLYEELSQELIEDSIEKIKRLDENHNAY